MAAIRSGTLKNAPRRTAFCVSSRNHRSTKFSQLELVGIKCSTKRSEEHTSELQSRGHLVCRLLLEKKKKHPFATAPSELFRSPRPPVVWQRARRSPISPV